MGYLGLMPTLRTKTKPTNTFKDYIAFVEERRSKGTMLPWYRGCGKARHELRPSLYRHKSSSPIEDFTKHEEELITRLQQRNTPFYNRAISNEEKWEGLF